MGNTSTIWLHVNCVASGDTICGSGNKLANYIILRRFLSLYSFLPYSCRNCVDSVNTIRLPYSARLFLPILKKGFVMFYRYRNYRIHPSIFLLWLNQNVPKYLLWQKIRFLDSVIYEQMNVCLCA